MGLNEKQIEERAKPILLDLMNAAEGKDLLDVLMAGSAFMATYLAWAALNHGADPLPGCQIITETMTRMAQDAYTRMTAKEAEQE